MNTQQEFNDLSRWVIHRAPWIIASLIVLTLASLIYTVSNLKVNTDTQDMIASHLDWRQDFIQLKQNFPDNYQSIVAIIEGKSKASVQAASQILYAKLGQTQGFENRFSYPLEPFFMQHQLLYMSEAQRQAFIDDAKSLMAFASLKPEHVGAFFNTLIKASAQPDSPFASDDFYQSLQRAVSANQNQRMAYLDWHNQFINDQYLEIIHIKPNIDYQTMLPGLDEINSIRHLFEQLQLASTYDVQLKLTGDIPLNLEELQSVDKSAHLAAIAAFIMVALLLIISFRQLSLVVISLTVLVMGLCLTAGFATVTIGHLNMISVAFAVLYIGLSIDFTIHIIMRIKEQDKAMKDAIVDSLAHLGPALAFCAVTTACAFYAFIPTTFKGISELGIIAGSGMIISFLMNILLLPAMLSYLKKPKASDWHLPALAFPARTVALGFIAIILASFLVLPKLTFNASPMDLRDPKQPSVVAYHELVESAPYPPNAITLMVDKAQTNTEQLLDALRALPAVKEVISLDSFVPKNQNETIKALTPIANQFANIRPLAPESTHMQRQAIQDYTEQLKQLPPSAIVVDLVDTLESYSDYLDLIPETAQRRHLNQLGEALLLDLDWQLSLIRRAGNLKPFAEDALPEGLIKRWQHNHLIKVDVFSSLDTQVKANRETFVNQVLKVDAHATGLPVIHQKAGKAVVNAFIEAFTIALSILVLLLIIVTRDIKKVLFTLVPLLSACVITGALAVLCGIEFNFANIIALPLLLGIGIDNGIHLVHRYYSSQSLFATSTTKAVIISTLTTIFSFANLSFSSHIGMSSMGMLLTLGMTVTFICTLVFLPSLLYWADGKSKGP